MPVRTALFHWHEHVDGDCVVEIRALRNRIELGQETRSAVACLGGPLEADQAALATVVAIHSRIGGDAARMIETLAAAAERRARASANADAYGAGARLSARLIAGLPLAFVPLAPMAKAPLTDPPGLVLLGLGVGLAVVGLAWVSALFPRPDPHDDPAAAIAEVMAAGVEGGGDVAGVLAEVCSSPPPGLAGKGLRIARLLKLGASWSEALARSGDSGLESLAETLSTAGSMGLPLAPALRNFAAVRREERERRFEAAIRRAPVRMAVPLAVCVLPSFVVLGVGPFLRGLSFAA
jgi:tight adherence protein B